MSVLPHDAAGSQPSPLPKAMRWPSGLNRFGTNAPVHGATIQGDILPLADGKPPRVS
jgi:hypothetical protein